MKLHLQDSTIVITGGSGFLGQHVVAELSGTAAKVIGLSSNDYDLRKRSSIDAMLSDLEPTAIIHLAAVVGGIGANAREPGRFLYQNAIMGIELIDACRVANVRKVVVAGTVCAYPKFTSVPFRESELWNGYPEETNAPYGLAKKLLLVQAQAYREQYGTDIAYLLPVNLYGPGDNFDLESGHVIPAMIRKFVEARDGGDDEVVLWGDGSPSREFLYVTDAARAFRLALEFSENSEPINIGSGEEITIAELAAFVAEAAGYEGSIHWDTTRPNGQPRRQLDTSRARERLGFSAEVDFATGIKNTVEYFEARKRTAS